MRKIGKYIISRKWFKALYGEWCVKSEGIIVIQLDNEWQLTVPADKVKFK
jgi:hypothetical protein